MAGFNEKIKVNNHRKSRRREVGEILFVIQLEPVRQVLPLIGSQLTTWSPGNLHYIRLHFFQLDREFFCLLPSLARLYSAAASPSERLRSDGSLAIINSTHYLFSEWPEAYSEFSKSAPGTSSSFRLYNNHVKDTQGHG